MIVFCDVIFTFCIVNHLFSTYQFCYFCSIFNTSLIRITKLPPSDRNLKKNIASGSQLWFAYCSMLGFYPNYNPYFMLSNVPNWRCDCVTRNALATNGYWYWYLDRLSLRIRIRWKLKRTHKIQKHVWKIGFYYQYF